MKSMLEKVRGEKYVGVAGLAMEAAKILAESGLAQERGTVSEVPDERTIRYYLTEGLVSPAAEKQGTASVFGYRHLLQLLVVKKLQSEHLPIRKIRDLVDGRTERELERLLGVEGSGAAAKNEALSYLEKLLTKPAAAAQTPQVLRRAPSLESLAGSTPPPAAATAPQPQSSAPTMSGGTWSRVELEPGLELHVHDRYQPPREAKGLRRVTQALLRVLEAYGQNLRK
jgi:DNA-binding transcriptional MerR regulator